MSGKQQRPSKRSIRLSEGARKRFETALHERWESERPGQRMTKRGCADLLGLSTPTLNKLLSGEVVDRTTAIQSFEKVGLDSTAEPDLQKESARTASSPPRWTRRETLIAGASAALVVMTVGAFSIFQRSTPPPAPPPQKDELWDLIAEAKSRYQAAEYQEAKKVIEKAVQIGLKRKDSHGLAEAHLVQGDVESVIGTLKQSRALYGKALRNSERVKGDPLRSAVFERIGTIDLREGKYGDAKSKFENVVAWCKAREEDVGQAEGERGLGTVAFLQGDLKLARDHFEHAEKLLTGLDQDPFYHDLRARKALVTAASGDIKTAQEMLDSVAKFWRSEEGGRHVRWIARTHLQHAMVAEMQADWSEATMNASYARELYEGIGDKPSAKESEEILERIEQKQNDALPIY